MVVPQVNSVVRTFLLAMSHRIFLCAQMGFFLDYFSNGGHVCEGVEFGESAGVYANKKYNVNFGVFPSLEFSQFYDLIIFRGVIEHVKNPKKYLDKAISLLNKDGYIFITATPNSESVCCKMFKELIIRPQINIDIY